MLWPSQSLAIGTYTLPARYAVVSHAVQCKDSGEPHGRMDTAQVQCEDCAVRHLCAFPEYLPVVGDFVVASFEA